MHRYGLLDASFAAGIDRTLPTEDELRERGGVQYMVLNSPTMAGMDLSGLNLRRNNFKGVSFQGADLRGTNLQGTTLSYANFEDALIDEDTNFEGAFWHETICPDGMISDARGCFNHAPEEPAPVADNVEPQPPATSPEHPQCKLHSVVNTMRGPDRLTIDAYRVDAQWALTTILSIYEGVDERQPQLPAALSRDDAFAVFMDARDNQEGWVSIFVLFPEEIAAEYFTGPGTSFRIPPSLAEEFAASAFDHGSAEQLFPSRDDCYRDAD
ncbi:hypothetical protein DL240_19270 [Lujinxingia litoralis]|uniref:Pentapeptide repeat-containing protein n=2 Tax=Lujinxingia litoralis TaxID=2211119 RepID=A0A328C145_9DELT|nr:hypothetical protein DL240_19270 [Lujinxingia litoralis]